MACSKAPTVGALRLQGQEMIQSFLCIPHIPVGYAGGRQKTTPAFSAFTTSLWLSNAGAVAEQQISGHIAVHVFVVKAF
jgi:hypothetical protein